MTALSTAALFASQQAFKFASLVQQKTPNPSPNSGPGEMGPLYDIWLGQIWDGSKQLGYATEAVANHLTNATLKKSFDSARVFFQKFQDTLEAGLQYKTPYTSKTNGPVWNKNPEDQGWFKPHARLVHRSQCMELLLLHMVKLEYILMLAHTSDTQLGTDLLGDQTAYNDSMSLLHTFLIDNQPDIPNTYTSYETKDLTTAALLFVLEDHDLSYERLEIILNECGSPVGYQMGLWLKDYAEWLIEYTDANGSPFPPESPDHAIQNAINERLEQATTAAAAAGAVNQVTIVAHLQGSNPGVAIGPARHRFFEHLNMAAIPGLQWQDPSQIRGPVEMFWQFALWDVWHAQYSNFVARKVAYETNCQLPIAGAVPTLQQVNAYWDNYVSAPANIREKASVLVARHRAFVSLCQITGSYTNEHPTLHKQSEEGFFQLMTLFTQAQRESIGFLPEFVGHDEKERLNAIFLRQEEFSSLVYKEDLPMQGQFTAQRLGSNVNITQMVAAREWSRPLAYLFEHQVLWGVVHCEMPLLADLLIATGPIVAANRHSRATHMPPIKEIHALLARAVSRFDVIREGDQARADPFYTAVGQVLHGVATNPAPHNIAQARDFNEFLKALKEIPSPEAKVAHNTQPMEPGQRAWMDKIKKAFEGLNSCEYDSLQPADNNRLPPYFKFHPLVLNCLTHRSYTAIPVGNPEMPKDNINTQNVVWRRPLPGMALIRAMALDTFYEETPAAPNVAAMQASTEAQFVQDALIAAWTVNSLFLNAMTPALYDLQSVFTAPPALYVLNSPINSLTLQMNPNGTVDHTQDLGSYLSPSALQVANRDLFTATFAINYPPPRVLAIQLQDLTKSFKKAYDDRKAPFTHPSHWCVLPTGFPNRAAQFAALEALQRWIQLQGNVQVGKGVTTFNFQPFARAPHRNPGPNELLLEAQARLYHTYHFQ